MDELSEYKVDDNGHMVDDVADTIGYSYAVSENMTAFYCLEFPMELSPLKNKPDQVGWRNIILDSSLP